MAALVMARAPRPGAVKRRLEPLIGPDGCALLQARLVEHAARVAAAVAPGAAYVAVDPPADAELLGDLAGPGVELFGQSGSDHGERLRAAADHVLERHDEPLAILATDAPALAERHVRAALETLAAGRDAAVGPALDGGWYLLALARPAPELFALPADSWGGPHVLGKTLRAAREAGLWVGLIAPAAVLDTEDDVRLLLDEGTLPDDVAAIVRVPTRHDEHVLAFPPEP